MKVGQKVVCIDGFTYAALEFGITIPIKGEIYTIRDWNYGTRSDNKNVRYFRFEEFTNGPMRDDNTGTFDEPSFCERAFREVDTKFGEEVEKVLEKDFRALEKAYVVYGDHQHGE